MDDREQLTERAGRFIPAVFLEQRVQLQQIVVQTVRKLLGNRRHGALGPGKDPLQVRSAGGRDLAAQIFGRLDDLARNMKSGVAIRRTRTRIRRPEEHTSELQSLMRISYAVF